MYNTYQDRNSSASFYYLAANRWLGYRLDIICAVLMTVVAFAPFIAHEAGLGKFLVFCSGKGKLPHVVMKVKSDLLNIYIINNVV